MPQRKRTSGAAGLDDNTEVESASSSFRQIHQKRSRVALAAERGGSVVSDDDDEPELNGYHDPHFKGAADDDDTNSSDGEQEDVEVDELRATQIVERQIRAHKENAAAEEGVIEEVFCRNFMCHSKLRIKLGPLINFIIGHNGSGKSAVLAALTMCLAGKASATNRGGSLKSLIKEGEESATLAVKIKNQGAGAFKPDLYGQSIIVERHFSRTGMSGFRLKNMEDKVISTKKADLEEILDYFAFQLDNPINVLTQDLARQFLSSNSPGDKYKFFITGTQLEQLDRDYKLLEERLDNTLQKLAVREEDIAKLKLNALEAEQRKRRLDKAQSIQDKIVRTRWMHAWAQVEEQERVLEKYTQNVEQAEQRVQDTVEAADAVSGTYEGHNQSYEAAKIAADDLKEQLANAQGNYDLEKDKFDANKNELLERVTEERGMKQSITAHRNNIKRLQHDIAAEQERLAGAGGTEHVDRLARLEQVKVDTVSAKEALNEHDKGFDELERTRVKAGQDVDAAKPMLSQKRKVQHDAENLLLRLQRDQNQQYAGYMNGMQNLVRAVNQETRWRTKPVGPMGLHIRLLEPKWSSILEKTFAGALEAFVVTCKEDQVMLSDLMRRNTCSPPVFIGDPTPLDTNGKEPDQDITTILRVLQIEHDLVRNQLIINQGIDQIALIEERSQALDFLYEGFSRPRNVRAAITFASRGAGTRYEYTRSGAQKSSPVYAWNGPARMKGNREDQINLQRETVNQAKRDVDEADQQVKRLRQLLTVAEQRQTAHNRERGRLKTKVQQSEDAEEAVKNEIEKHRPQQGKLEALQNQLKKTNEDLDRDKMQYQDMINAKDQLHEVAREIKPRTDAAFAELEDCKERSAGAQQRIARLEGTRGRALREKNEAMEMIDERKRQKAQVEADRDRQQVTLQDVFMRQAEQICRRVPVDEGVTPDVLDDRLEKFRKDLERIQHEAGGSREELTLAWQKANKEYNDSKTQMDQMDRFHKTISRALDRRQYRWRMFRKYITARARIMFAYLLSERQFRGRVLMDHDAQELDIRVEPDLAKDSDSGREGKTLSGGEKSFSTICLLLSIWEAMGSPIRCLDEFDVFMDSVNRAASMGMMIEAARRSVGRQFILITPQAMNNVQLGDDVKIHRMSDPERGQTTLPY